jgi:hypothetical protein
MSPQDPAAFPSAHSPVDGWVRERRTARRAAGHALPDDAPRWGLALSGGGIRSATFCLGLLRALARQGLLLRFDLLSTVSGGGYVGAMLGRLFNDCRAPDEADRVNEALHGEHTARPAWFLWWLRANGRYLVPSGLKDGLFAAAQYLRNLVAVHIELALLALLAGVALCALDLSAWALRARWTCATPPGPAEPLGWLDRLGCPPLAPEASPSWLDSGLWGDFVPVAWLPLPLLLLAGLVLACAYWVVGRTRRLPVGITMATLALTAATAALLRPDAALMPLRDGAGERQLFTVLAGLFALAWLLAWPLAAWAERRDPAGARQWLTRGLSALLRAGLLCLGLGVITRLAWLLAFDIDQWLAAGGVLAAFTLVARALVPLARQLSGQGLSSRLVIGLASLCGWMMLAGWLVWWVSLVQAQVLGAAFGIDTLLGPEARGADGVALGAAARAWALLAVPLGLYLLGTRGQLEFLNASSLHAFYRARLTRAYLGAGNRARFKGPDGQPPRHAHDELPEEPADGQRVLRQVDEVHGGDEVPMTAYAPHRHGAPVHLMGCCINQTRDPRGGLHNRDRRGLTMTIGPLQQVRVGLGPWQASTELGAAALQLGQWMAISGAAFSPGLGSATRGGLSVLATLAGVRLGYWWNSARPTPAVSKPEGLLAELTGRFRGTERRQWFLSDGGHAENTGAYALLAERCQLVLLADCGADPEYRFEDLENLMRRARIDLKVHFEALQPREPDGQAPDARWRHFGTLEQLRQPNSTRCLALFRLHYPDQRPGLLVLVKPSLWDAMPVDLLNYHAQNPSFPQQSTMDQFFDEAQWESYHLLGRELGALLPGEALEGLGDTVDRHFVRAEGGTPDPAPTATGPRGGSLMARPVQATLGLGAVLTAAVGTWQTVEGGFRQLAQSQANVRIDSQALVKAWSQVPAPTAPEYPQAVGQLAAEVARTADSVCPSRWGRGQLDLAGQVLRDALAHCQGLAERPVAAPTSCRFLLEASTRPGCVQSEPPPPASRCSPRYWAFDYLPGQRPAACQTPQVAQAREARELAGRAQGLVRAQAASAALLKVDEVAAAASDAARTAAAAVAQGAPLEAAAACTPGAATTPCCQRTVYVQTFGPEQRDKVQGWRQPWRALGATVPAVEDVMATARSQNRPPPRPTARTTVRYKDATDLACAVALEQTASVLAGAGSGSTPTWGYEPLPAALRPRDGVLEVWVAPLAAPASAPTPR